MSQMKTNPEVDKYIARQADFARPVLERLRKAFHKGCTKLEEHIKWGVPSFEYKGMMVGFAAFKQHVAWGFWKASLMEDPDGILGNDRKASPFADKVRRLSDLPSDAIIVKYVKQAAKLNETGVKLTAARRKRPELKAPAEMLAALKKNKAALKTFEAFSPSNQRDYVEWIVEAKQDATRNARLKQAIEWMAEGKPRNWKYMKEWK